MMLLEIYTYSVGYLIYAVDIFSVGYSVTYALFTDLSQSLSTCQAKMTVFITFNAEMR